MSNRIIYLLSEMVELARMTADHCLDLEKELANKPNLDSISATEIKEWMRTIHAVASRGVFGCTLYVTYPNSDFLELAQMKPIVMKAIREFFAGSEFRITRFGDWSLVPTFANAGHYTLETKPTVTVHAQFGISWRYPPKTASAIQHP